MRILHVINSFEIGGAQRLLSDLLPILAKAADVELLVIRPLVANGLLKKLIKSNIKVMSLDELNLYNPKIFFKLRKITKKYNIIHAHLFPSLYWVAFAKTGGVKLVYTEHNTSNKRRNKFFFKFLERIVYSRYSLIISISRKVQDNLQQWLCKKNDAHFVVINNGVDLTQFSIKKAVYKSCHKKILMIARFVPSKDQMTLIKAMQFVNENVKLCLVGSGITFKSCVRLAEDLSLTERIEFLGTRDDIPFIIAGSYIGVQSSHWEGFGLTAVEMMSAGLPVIASDVDGLREIVENYGLIFEHENARDLAEKINSLLSDDSYYKEISQKCMARAQDFSIERMAESYIWVYKDLLKNKAKIC